MSSMFFGGTMPDVQLEDWVKRIDFDPFFSNSFT